ncbi:MAG: lysostaphin resistance A-like protein [Anaerolineae bacterium]
MAWFRRPSQEEGSQPFARLEVALAFVILLDGTYLLGGPFLRALLRQYSLVWSALWLALPLADVWSRRGSLACLGYRRTGWWRWYLWGVAAGALWRLADVLLATGVWGLGVHLGLREVIPWGAWLLNGLVIVPLLEETFFRGYLQAGLAHRLGPWPAILLQAFLFASHPWHLAQGWVHWPSIFLFGVVTGWLRQRTDSLGGPWGAHGMANVLPEAVVRLAGLVWG